MEYGVGIYYIATAQHVALFEFFFFFLVLKVKRSINDVTHFVAFAKRTSYFVCHIFLILILFFNYV